MMDAEIKKRALRLFTYGLYVITARDGQEIAAGTVNWVSQASFTPPLVMVGVKTDSHAHALIDKTGQFALNILGSEQKAIAQDFFRPSQADATTVNGHPFSAGLASGSPILTEAPAWIEAKVVDSVKAGDHTVFVAEVVEAGLNNSDAKPLEMWKTGWFYGG